MTDAERIARAMGVPFEAPKAESITSVNLSAVRELISEGELAVVKLKAATLYESLCRNERAATVLLEDTAEALGLAPTTARRLIDAVARLVGLRAPTTSLQSAGSAVTDAVLTPIFEES